MWSYAKNVVFLAFLTLLAGCGRSGLTPTPTTPGINSEVFSSATSTSQSAVTTGNFTEYSLPAGAHPSDLARGPYNTLYFTAPNNGLVSNAAHIYEMLASTGHVYTYTAPAPYVNFGGDVVSFNRSVYFFVIVPIYPDEFFFARITPEHKFSFESAPYLECGVSTNLALGPDGKAWYGYQPIECAGQAGIIQPPGTQLDNQFVPYAITPGPGGNMYITAYNPGFSPADSRVYVMSTSGVVLHIFDLPIGSFPQAIATGSDHNLWVAEPGINKIARVTPAGATTQFALPTANAGPDRITGSYDSALYFTEKNANKIGRITTAGKITEYKIPTANSGPTCITPCTSTTDCGPHGGVWFTETTANKIGKFNAPI